MFAPPMIDTPKRRRKRAAPVIDAILEYLRDFKRDPDNDGNSPTYAQIASAVGKNPGDVYRRVQTLERWGDVRINKYGKIVLVGGKYVPPD